MVYAKFQHRTGHLPAAYTRPDPTPDVLQWGGIAFGEALKSFGFKATPRAVLWHRGP